MSRGETSRYLQVCIIRLNTAVIKKIRGLERDFLVDCRGIIVEKSYLKKIALGTIQKPVIFFAPVGVGFLKLLV